MGEIRELIKGLPDYYVVEFEHSTQRFSLPIIKTCVGSSSGTPRLLIETEIPREVFEIMCLTCDACNDCEYHP